ncbi:MAG: ABC transporter substrate-binding protein [Clostridiales bacterium]|nr:ABC transporter substrate-binding protein [Clostridiales bacterium]
MFRKVFCITLVIVMVMGLAACGGSTEDVSRPGDEVIIAMGPNSEPEAGFDPAYGWGAGEHVHEPLIQSTLTVTNNELEIEYDLATSVEVSDDGLLWTVEIRDDVYFTDGEKLTAGDVAFTYNTVKEKSTVNDFTMLREAVAVNDTTVEFHMNSAYSIWPYSMAIVGIVPEHAYDENYGLDPVGSGRYVLKQWDKGQQIILEANPEYYGEAPLMKKVVIVFMTEDAAFAAVKAGQVDIAYTAATYSKQTVNGYSLIAMKSVDNRGISLPAVPDNGEKGNNVTCDAAVRKAINIGIDREKLIDNILNGYGTAAYSVCDGLPWFYEGSVVEYDFDEAVRILDEAGWVSGDDGIRVKDGVRAELNIMYSSGDSVRQAIAAEVSNQLSLLGIKVTYEGVGWDVAYDRAQREPMVWGWGAHTPMEVYNMYHSVAGDGLAQYSPYGNADADVLMDKALSESDLEHSYELWQDAQEVVVEEVPWVWIVNIDHLYWTRDGLKVAEQKIHPHGHGWSLVNNVDQWTWESAE